MFKAIIKLAYPVISARLLNVLLDIVSVFIVAHLGLNLLSAYGVTMPLYLTVYLIFMAYMLVYSAKAGALRDDVDAMAELFVSGLIFAVFLSLGTVLILLLLPTLLPFLGQSSFISSHAGDFFYFVTLGVPAVFISSIFNQTLIIYGHSAFVTTCAVIHFVTGALGIYMLSHQFDLGLAGVALGLAIANWLRLMLSAGYFIRLKQIDISHGFQHIASLFSNIRELLRLGGPVSMQYGGELLAGSVATLMIGHLYAHALAAQQVANQIRVLLLMLPFGLSQAVSVLASKYKATGHQNFHRDIHNLCQKAMILGLLAVLTMAIVFNVLSVEWIGLFIHRDAPELIHLTRLFIVIVSIALLADTVKYIVMGLLRGLDNTKGSMMVSLICHWLIGLPASYVLGYPMGYGPIGIAAGSLVGLIVSVMVLLKFYFHYVEQSTN